MAHIRILNAEVEIGFEVGENPLFEMDEEALLAGAQEMAGGINGLEWPEDHARAFESMKKIVFFEGRIRVNDWLVDRPCCDEDDAVFYWESSEFLANPDPSVRASTLFHDCWHVVQFKRDGGFARTEAERVDREIEAIDEQIQAAERLGCDASAITFLENFRADQKLIEVRLAEGVSRRMRHQRGVLQA